MLLLLLFAIAFALLVFLTTTPIVLAVEVFGGEVLLFVSVSPVMRTFVGEGDFGCCGCG